jgi:glucose/arabinose dehydrogenase
MHSRTRIASVTTFMAVVFASSVCAQQPDPLTDFQITGHVYEAQAVPPIDQRISQLKLPSGFDIQRFAEGLYNPRMLAVAEDGTAYVTQRTPGNLVMLRDLDRDGVVDSTAITGRASRRRCRGHSRRPARVRSC